MRGLLQLPVSLEIDLCLSPACLSGTCTQRMPRLVHVTKPKVTSLGQAILHVLKASVFAKRETQVCLASCVGVFSVPAKPPHCFRAGGGWDVCELSIKVQGVSYLCPVELWVLCTEGLRETQVFDVALDLWLHHQVAEGNKMYPHEPFSAQIVKNSKNIVCPF